MTTMRLSVSRIETFLHCRKKYYWVYVENLVPVEEVPKPLQVGALVHHFLHKVAVGEYSIADCDKIESILSQWYPDNSPELSEMVVEETKRLLFAYLENYQDDPLHIVSSELHCEIPYRDVSLYARVDGLVTTQDGRLWHLERKTAARVDQAYLQGIKTSLQIGIYQFVLSELLRRPLYGTLLDLLVKTKVPQFQRSYLPLSRPRMERALETVDGVLRDLRRAHDTNDFYPSNRCYTYSTVCPYLLLCEHDSPTVRESQYKKREETP